jgi:hypothetical protein
MNQRADLTFKHNRNAGRHGWLRLTPAYSVKLVTEILGNLAAGQTVIDPFSGTGTTAVVAVEQGHDCDAFDINPFLVWLAETKTRTYTADERGGLAKAAREIAAAVRDTRGTHHWVPPIAAIERWWSAGRLKTLAAIYAAIAGDAHGHVTDLLKIAFCRILIDWSNAAFNHQSMSFRPVSGGTVSDDEAMVEDFIAHSDRIAADVAEPTSGRARFLLADSRQLQGSRHRAYTALITSPPYPNRMSYVRELRPYMYWLGFFSDRRAPGELDWQAIGGTWGCATSRVESWRPAGLFEPRHPIHGTVTSIARSSPLLANYVHKYFEDMTRHFDALVPALADGARVFYVVGNSKFYDVILPVEELYADLMRRAGLRDVAISAIRKRNSKKELFEFMVSAMRGAASTRIAVSSRSATQSQQADLVPLGTKSA